jgi:HPt (histidine-containing phosphotransfer) domain-containing protein
MTIQACYAAMGADYDGVASRLRTEERIRKFLLKFPQDPSYNLLCTSLQSRNMEDAFRAAHTIKGVCQNLSLTKLYQSSSNLTEMLRGRTEYIPELEPALEAVKKDYGETVSYIQEL